MIFHRHVERLSNEVVAALGTRWLQGQNTHSSQFRRDVSSFISQHTCATRGGFINPSRFLLARNETVPRKQNILIPAHKRASRQQPADFPSHFRLFGYTYLRATASVYRWIAGYLHIRVRPLSPFSRVSSYRYANTSNLDFTTWPRGVLRKFTRRCVNARVSRSLMRRD